MKRKLFEEVEGEENKVPTTSQGAPEKPAETPGRNMPKADLLKLPYPQFTANLKKLVDADKDGKVKALINSGINDGNKVEDAFNVEWDVDFPVTQLKPLQNEIDMDGSLLYPLSGESSNLESILKGESVLILGPVVVYNDGSNDWIVDGHHRWSGVYGINKDGKVKGCRLTSKSKAAPSTVLKATQMAIAAVKGDVPMASVKGTNLMTIDEQALKDYVKTGKGCAKDFKGIQEDVIKRFASVKEELNSSDAIANYIWGNILSMRKTAGTLWKKLNIKRDFMPQTDLGAGGPAKDAETKKTVKKMASGEVDWVAPFKEGRLVKTFESFVSSRKSK